MKVKYVLSVPLWAVFQHVVVVKVEAATAPVVFYKTLEAAATKEREDGASEVVPVHGPARCHANQRLKNSILLSVTA